MDLLDAKQSVLQWASSAPSFEKIGFLNDFVQNMGSDEMKVAIVMMTNAKHKSKRKWLGEPQKDAEAREAKTIKYAEDPSETDPPSALPVFPSGLPVCAEVGVDLPVPWWRKFQKDQVVGYDVECVSLLHTKVKKMRGGKVAVVDSSYNTCYKSDIFHRPGTFSTHPKAVAKSGIRKHDLVNGVPMNEVRQMLLKHFDGKLVVICGGVSDFSCVDLQPNTDNILTYDLQTFYRWIPEEEMHPKPMSLRDIHFLELGWDFQGTVEHTADEDASATLRCFFKGYVKRNMDKATRADEFHYEIFEKVNVTDFENKNSKQFIRLAETDKLNIFFCKTNNKFLDFKKSKCQCESCKVLFANKY